MAQFEKGRPRHPQAGRRAGTPNRRADRARHLISEIDDQAIVAAVIEAAKAGPGEARALYFRFLRLPLPRSETFIGPIGYVRPRTPEEAREKVLELGEHLAKGEISIEAHDALVGGLRIYLGDRAAEQQRQLDQLREDLGLNGHELYQPGSPHQA
jgi:hypothetical protein